MKKVLFVLVALVLAVSVSLVACGGPLPPEAPESIIVGIARDLDEAQTVFECFHAGPLYRWFVSKVNAEGGIYLSYYDQKVPLELKVRDFSLASWDIGTVVQGLIDDGANVIWGGPSTDSIYTLAPVCNANGVCLITLEGGASKMIWEHQNYLDQWPYVWVTLSFANWYQIPVLKGILSRAVTGRDPKAYVTYIGGLGAEHGLEYTQTTIQEFGAANVLPSGGLEHPFMMTQEEANTIIQGAIAALGDPARPNYDVFCAYTYPWNVAALFSAIQSFGFNPPAILFGPGSSQGYFTATWGKELVEGIMSFTMANEKTTVKVGTPTISMADMYAAIGGQIEKDWQNYTTVCPKPPGATSGTDWLDFWGQPCFLAGLEMWKAAVEEVGKLDNRAIRDVLASYSASKPAKTCFGDTWFEVYGNGYGGGVLSYKCHTGEIGQWQSGIMETVGYTGVNTVIPNYCATANFIFPMTDKWAWLKD